MRKIYLLLTAITLLGITANAQLTGTKNIPGDYADLAAAITALNASGVGAGGVIINVVAGNPQTASGAAYGITATGTAANPITVQGNGNSITYTGTAGTLDGVFVLNGCDYTTIDNFVITVSDATTEWGVALLTPTNNNGCQNDTVRNMSITLNKTNLLSFGIYSAHHTNALNTALVPTLFSGTNSYNKFYNNQISNVYSGYSFTGYPQPAPYDLYDQRNEVGNTGGISSVSNFGGGASQAQGLIAISQNKIKVYKTNISGGTGSTGIVYGINLSTGLNSDVDIYNDTISLTSSAAASAMYGITSSMGGTGAGNTVNMYNNRVENCSYTVASSGEFRGINTTATASYTNMYGNIITNNTLNTTGAISPLYYAGSSATLVLQVDIYNNTITNNFRTAAVASGVFNALYASANSTVSKVRDNIVNNNGNAVSSSGATYGYYNNASGYSEQLYNNQISNLTGGTGETVAAYVRSGSGPTNKLVYNNQIYNITGQGLTGAILMEYATDCKIYKNNIYNITSNNFSAAPAVYGIQTGTNVNTDVTIYNNFISELKAPVCSTATAIYGMWLQAAAATGQIKAYYNTVYLNASSSSLTLFGTAAVVCSSNPIAVDLRNNVLVNVSTPGPTGGNTSVLSRAGVALTNYSLLSGNNCMYAGTPAANRLIYSDGTNNDQTLQAFKDRVNPRDQSSFTELPPFVNVASSPYDLHISGATQCENGGQPVAAVTVDYDGTSRSGTFPDVGADEFAGTMSDIASPNIQYVVLGSDLVAASRTLTALATIKDPSGINTTAGTNPRLYYKKKTQANTYNDNTNATDGWKYVEASNGTSPFNFTIDYTKLLTGGVVAGDTIQYFIVAQDLNATARISLNAGSFTAQPASVNLTAAEFPLNGAINQYGITATVFAGSVNVGSAETITSLTNAGGLFQQIKSAVLSGDLTVQVNSDLLLENGQFALANWSESGVGGYRITIVPDAATIRTIQGLSSAAALIRLDSADRVTIDGRFGGSGNYLRFRNTNSLNPALLLVNDAQNNIIRNCIFESNNTTATTQNTAGVIQIGNSNIVNGSGNDNNIITYNEIRDRSDIAGTPQTGIIAIGSTGSLSLYNDNNTISNNNIHDFFNAAITTTQTGIYIAAGNSRYNIDSNSIYQTVPRTYTLTGALTRGIFITQGSSSDNYGGYNIRYNYIGGTAPNGGANGNYWTTNVSGTAIVQTFNGINVSSGILPSVISNNVIKNIDFTSVSPTAAASQFIPLSTSQGIWDINNNQVGAPTGNDSIKVTINVSTGTNSTSFQGGIIAFNGGNSGATITNNKVGGITTAGSATAAIIPQYLQIQGTPAQPAIISNNLVGSLTTPNSILANYSANPQLISFGIRILPSTGVTITASGNTLQNITDNSSSTATQDFAILLTNTVGLSSSPVVTNNVIKEFASNAGATAATLANVGIQVQSYTGNSINVSGNTISGMRSTNAGAAVLSYPVGINVSANTATGMISKNKLYDFTNTAAGGAGIYGIYTISGTDWTVSNNMIGINNGANTNNIAIYGIVDQISAGGNFNGYYNSVYIGGNNAPASAQNNYGYIRYGNSTTSFRNNLINIDRVGGTGFSYAIANASTTPTTGWSSSSSSYNTFITPTSTNVGEWNAAAQTFASWKTTSGGDLESYADVNANATVTNMFTNAGNGDLTIKTANAESWYVNGKGIAGALSGSLASDYTGDARGTIVGTPTDIGADEFTPDAGVLPPDAIPSAAPAPSTITSYSFAGRKLGEIIWGASVPTSVSWKYYSGIPGPSTTGAVINSYHDVPAVGTGPFNYDMKLYYTLAEQNQIADASLRGIKKDGASPWVDISGTPSSDADGKFVTSTGLTTFSLFTLKDVLNPIPVKLVSFTGRLNATATVDLQWQVTEQLGIKQYEVERSIDGRNFTAIGTVTANAANSFTYMLNDARPVMGKNYYRLRIVENDGRYNYSQVVVITLRGKESFVIYPVPAVDRITIQTNKKELMNTIAQLVDVEGKVINKILLISQVQQVNVSTLPAGIYFLKTEDGNSYRMVKQ